METENKTAPNEPHIPVKKKKHTMRKWFIIFISLLLLGGGGFVYVRYYFVFGTGIKTGTLNYVVHKGFIFKTYEGELILTGITSNEQGIKSNEFSFSISNRELAEEMMRLGGKQLELSYKEYLAPLPWRGHSKFVVNKIISVSEASSSGVPYVNQIHL